MKKSRIILTLASLLLLLSIVLNLGGCMNSFASDDLMKGVKARNVTGKDSDDAFILAQTELALKLFKASANESKNENVLISPLSILLALAMTANGADNETRAEMEALLGGDIPLEELNEYIYTYVNSLPSSEKAKLEIANSIWFKDSESFKANKDFLQTNADYYGAEIYKSAFDESTLNDINSWVSKNTDGMIKKIYDEIDPDSVMFLINALVFDAEWEKKYTEKNTWERTFTSVTGEERTVEFMHSSEYKYIQGKNVNGFIKNYKGGKYSFVALLPDKNVSIYRYIESLSAESIAKLLDNVYSNEVKAAIPKFESDYSIILNDILSDLGMSSAFASGSADFSKLGHSDVGNLFISEVVHKTFISVDENGTKAAAVTGSNVDCEGESSTVTITLDRPFVYMIIDNETNLPIFIGAVTDINN